MKPRQEVHNMF